MSVFTRQTRLIFAGWLGLMLMLMLMLVSRACGNILKAGPGQAHQAIQATLDSTEPGDTVSANADYDPCFGTDPLVNILKLDVQSNPVFLQPGEYVVIDMDALNLTQHVFGCQAVLNFDSSYFLAGSGDIDVQPGGGVWNELIYSAWNIGGDLDVAVGVDLTLAVGTKSDGTVAKCTLTADPAASDGTTQMVFRPDGDDVSSTFFSDALAQPVYPGSKINSQDIVIDGTDPVLENLTAIQTRSTGPVDVLDCVDTVLQGTVQITIDAYDWLAGLADVPEIDIDGPAVLAIFLIDGDGPTYSWSLPVDANSVNGTYTITITATDRAGNYSTATGWLCVNKNTITGVVAMDTWTCAVYGFTRDVTFKASDALGSVLAQWTVPVAFDNDDESYLAFGSFELTAVPNVTCYLSAKTDWSLRRRLPISFDGNGQATIDFGGSNYLLGGDLNDSNTTNILDFVILRANWYTHWSPADINGDGDVKFSDFLTLKHNWFLAGDPE